MRISCILLHLIFINLIWVSQPGVAATLSDLIDVSREPNTSCVEYYSYQGKMFCSTTPQSEQTVSPQMKDEEKQAIVFDDRPWKLAWGKKDNVGTSIEYIPRGEDINHWHELVTSQFFPGLQDKGTPYDFATAVVKGIESAGFKPIVTFIKNTPQQVIFEFRIESPANQVQDEIQMITKGHDGLYVLHYAIKEPNMGEKNRNKWVENLSRSKMVQ